MAHDEQHSSLAIGDQHLVVARLAGESYGISIDAVRTIIRVPEITEIPRAPSFVEGIINLRGAIVPVIDLRKRLGLPVQPLDRSARIVVVETPDGQIGLLVDAVTRTLVLSGEQIEPTSPIVVSVDTAYVRGVGKLEDELVILLDVERVLTADESTALRRMETDTVPEKDV